MNKEIKRPSAPQEKSPQKPFNAKLTVIISLSAIALVFAVCMIINISIGVREIEIEGADLCTEEEILSASGVAAGRGYFSYNTSRSEKNVQRLYPCVVEINISRSVFGKVKISITEEKALWYVESFDEYFALSEDLRVIKSSDSRDRFIAHGLVRLDFPEIKSLILGQVIEVRDDIRDTDYIPAFLEEVKKTDIYSSGRLDHIRFKNKFEVFMVVDCQYKVIFGNCKNVEKKMFGLKSVLAEERFSGEDKWEINVSDLGNIVTRIDHGLDFSYLLPIYGG